MQRVTLHRLPLDMLMARLEAFADPPERMREKEWTAKDDERLIEFRRRRLSFREIAEVLGRTAHCCAQRAHRIGVTTIRPFSPDWGEEDNRRLAELRSLGLRSYQIAERMNRTRNAVQQRAYRLGLTRKHSIAA